MTSNTMDKDRNAYPLNRDLLASARLHMQHHLWISTLGYHLHPSVPLSEKMLVAEVACGTGIFSLEVAKQLPIGSKIEAYDLSLAQCPPPGCWPGNVAFNELDIFDPTPEELAGRYDAVFLRHLICVVQSGDPMPLLSALLKLLKPGGYLQWQEWDLQTQSLFVSGAADSAEEHAPKLKAFVDSIRGPDALRAQTSWVHNIHERFDDAGTELIAHHRCCAPKESILLKQEIMFMTVREWIDNLRARDAGSLEAEKLEKLADEALEECVRLRRGSAIDNDMVTWVVRKK